MVNGCFYFGISLICLCEKKKLTATVASVNSFTDGYEKENKLSGGQVYTPTRTRVILRNCLFLSLK